MNRGMGLLGAGVMLTALALCGCGGGGNNSGDPQTTIHGRLQQGSQTLPNGAYVQAGSYVDVYSCTARRDGSAQVDLKSSDFDSFLIIGPEDNSGVVTDDNSGSGQNARVNFNVNQDVRYYVAATNADGAGRTGSYELDFSSNLKDVREEPGVTPAILAAAARALQNLQARKAQPATVPPAPSAH